MNFLKRCWHRRWIRGLLWTAVSIITLIALLYAWVDWRGARQWSATQAMLTAEGETLDFRATMNEPVREAENFCAIPLLKDLALTVDNDTEKGPAAEKRKRLEALKLPTNASRPGFTTAGLGKRNDVKAWADWLRKEKSLPMPADSGDAARDVLAALAKQDAVVKELAADLDRPKAQWTPEWKTRELPETLFSIALPHYSSVMAVNQTLSLRATAAASSGDAAKAHESALIMARLSQASLNDPFLIGLLVAASGTNLVCGTTWELCDAHAGTAEDFTRLEAALAVLDFHKATLRAMRSEMTAAANTLQFAKRRRDESFGLFQSMSIDGSVSSSFINKFTVRLIPGGFFDANAAVLADREFEYLIKPSRDHGWQEARRAAKDWEKELIDRKIHIWTHPSYCITVIIGPVITSVINNAMYAQSLVNQAVIGCALERYHIKNGSYPDSLDAIKLSDGKPLPLDVANGKPMNYRKTVNDRYALWSVGLDGKDDGGKRVLNEKRPESTKFHNEKYVGDWVWDFPEK